MINLVVLIINLTVTIYNYMELRRAAKALNEVHNDYITALYNHFKK